MILPAFINIYDFALICGQNHIYFKNIYDFALICGQNHIYFKNICDFARICGQKIWPAYAGRKGYILYIWGLVGLYTAI